MRVTFAAASGLAMAMSLASPAHAQESCSACGELPSCTVDVSACGGCGAGGGCNACSGCNACEAELPACGVCGTAQCWDCSGEEGIDVDSLTPAAQSKKLYEASLARIKFELPEDAGVSLLDQKMTTLGAKRAFVVSVQSQDKDYKYEIKVDVVRGGKKYFKKIKIKDLRAGMILLVKVESPPVPDGEPGEIIVEAAPEHVGGKPPAEDDEDKAAPPEPEADPAAT